MMESAFQLRFETSLDLYRPSDSIGLDDEFVEMPGQVESRLGETRTVPIGLEVDIE